MREGSDGQQQVQRSQPTAQEQRLQRVRVEDEGERVTDERIRLEVGGFHAQSQQRLTREQRFLAFG